MRHLTLTEVLELHDRVIEQSGGSAGIRDFGGLMSALAQPRMTFGGEDLYPTIVEKASVIAFSLIKNHPFVDGNKRIGHAAMETLMLLNGLEIDDAVSRQEKVVLQLAAGSITREEFTDWVVAHTVERKK